MGIYIIIILLFVKLSSNILHERKMDYKPMIYILLSCSFVLLCLYLNYFKIGFILYNLFDRIWFILLFNLFCFILSFNLFHIVA